MKKNHARASALLLAATVGTVVIIAPPAQADVERSGTCAGAVYKLSVEREDGGLEVDVDLDKARVGSSWRVTLRHNGKVVTSKVRKADREGEIDLDVRRRDRSGTDAFRLTVRPGGGTSCSVKASI